MKRGLFLVFFCCLQIVYAEESNTRLTAISPGQVETSLQRLGMEERISLDLRNIEIVDALKYLSLKSGLNIVTTSKVAGRLTLMVENVPIRDIFDIMLRSNGLAYTKENEIYNVMAEEEYKALFGKNFIDIRQVRVFRLQYAIPAQAFTLIDTLKSSIGRVLVEPDSGTVMVMDTPESIRRIEETLSVLEQKNLVRVFNLQYAVAKDVEEKFKAQFEAKGVGSISSDPRSNQLIIQALPERMEDIEKLINFLDIKTKEVLIDAKIIKVKLSNELAKGFEWEGLMALSPTHGLSYLGSYPFSVLQAGTAAWQSRQEFRGNQTQYGIGAYPFSGNTASVASSQKVIPGEKMHIGLVATHQDLDAVIKFLSTKGNTQILSNPKLAVINNREARIHVGEDRFYIKSTTTTGQATTTVSEEPVPYKVGIQLSVTPTINDESYVTMKIKPEISSVVSYLVTPLGNQLPIIDTSMAETTVMVKDGATIIIGGLRKEEKSSSAKEIPILSKIPVINFFFRSSSDKKERTELLVMLTPHIVSGEKLTTGNERDFGTNPTKGYKEYPSFSKELEKGSESDVTIKGERSYE